MDSSYSPRETDFLSSAMCTYIFFFLIKDVLNDVLGTLSLHLQMAGILKPPKDLI